jgi:hypothetical protein
VSPRPRPTARARDERVMNPPGSGGAGKSAAGALWRL